MIEWEVCRWGNYREVKRGNGYYDKVFKKFLVKDVEVRVKRIERGEGFQDDVDIQRVSAGTSDSAGRREVSCRLDLLAEASGKGRLGRGG